MLNSDSNSPVCFFVLLPWRIPTCDLIPQKRWTAAGLPPVTPFQCEPAFCGRTHPEPCTWFHTFTSEERSHSSWKNVKFHALYYFFITFSSFLRPPLCVYGACVWEPLIHCLMKSASPPPYPLLSFSGCLAPELWSMISTGSLVTTDWEEKQLTMGDRRFCVSGPACCKVMHVLLTPSPPVPHKGGIELKRWLNGLGAPAG